MVIELVFVLPKIFYLFCTPKSRIVRATRLLSPEFRSLVQRVLGSGSLADVS